MFDCGLSVSAIKGTVWVARAGARIRGDSGERERRIWAPVTSKVIPQVDAEVNHFSGI